MTTSGTATPDTCKACSDPKLRSYDADVVDYLNAAQSAFHCVAEVTARLVKNGFEVLDERKAWTIQPNGKYIVTRNGSSLCAFAVGGKFDAETSGAICVGAHTDSPNLRLKPRPDRTASGYRQLGV